MGNMRSALEIAMEKVARLGEATEEERLKWKYLPEGEQLAIKYLKEEHNLAAALSQYPENVRQYIVQGAAVILARNINLPQSDTAKKNNRKSMDGLKILKSDKVSVENVFSKIRQLFNHYAEQGEQQRKQAYESLKTEHEAKMQQAVQQQLGTLVRGRMDVEKQPQFQQEWRRRHIQLDSQYLNLLNEHKRELSNLG